MGLLMKRQYGCHCVLILLILVFTAESFASEIPPLSIYERAIVYLLDKGVPSTGYQFEDTFVVKGKDASVTYGPLSIGKALVLNEKFNREVGPSEFAAMIVSKIKIRGDAAGEIVLRWHPSQSFLALAAGLVMYRLDRAYPWPQFLLDLVPKWFDPQPKHEPFVLEWHHLTQLLTVKKQRPELNFLENVIREMQVLNSDVDDVSANGMITYYGDTATNKTIFIFEVTSEFPGALRCSQHVRSNYNPFTQELRHAQGRVNCDWADLPISSKEYQ